MSLRVSLLRVNEVRKLGRITYEEDGGVVEDPVPVALLCFQFDGETTRIASSVCRARLPANRGETDSSVNSIAYSVEQLLRRNLAQVMSDLKITVRSCTFGMNLVCDKSLVIPS